MPSTLFPWAHRSTLIQYQQAGIFRATLEGRHIFSNDFLLRLGFFPQIKKGFFYFIFCYFSRNLLFQQKLAISSKLLPDHQYLIWDFFPPLSISTAFSVILFILHLFLYILGNFLKFSLHVTDLILCRFSKAVKITFINFLKI